MVKISHIPLKEIRITEVIYYDSPEKMAKIFAPAKLMGQPIIFMWVNGVLFNINPLPLESDKLMDDFLDGIAYWGGVEYTLMPEFKPVIMVSSNIGGNVEIGVQDASVNSTLVEVATWLKEHAKNKK